MVEIAYDHWLYRPAELDVWMTKSAVKSWTKIGVSRIQFRLEITGAVPYRGPRNLDGDAPMSSQSALSFWVNFAGKSSGWTATADILVLIGSKSETWQCADDAYNEDCPSD